MHVHFFKPTSSPLEAIFLKMAYRKLIEKHFNACLLEQALLRWVLRPVSSFLIQKKLRSLTSYGTEVISADVVGGEALVYSTSIAAILIFIACIVVIAFFCVRYNRSRGEGIA